jgi:hypothetical protein
MSYINDQKSQVKRGNVLSRLGQVCKRRAANGSFRCSNVHRCNSGCEYFYGEHVIGSVVDLFEVTNLLQPFIFVLDTLQVPVQFLEFDERGWRLRCVKGSIHFLMAQNLFP